MTSFAAGFRSDDPGRCAASLGYSEKNVAAVPETPVRFATTAIGGVTVVTEAGTTVTPPTTTRCVEFTVSAIPAQRVPEPLRVSQIRVGGTA